MKVTVLIIRILLGIALMTYAVDHISQPSNFYVVLGVLEVVIAVILIFPALKYFITNL